jgi:hypothetical protein
MWLWRTKEEIVFCVAGGVKGRHAAELCSVAQSYARNF